MANPYDPIENPNIPESDDLESIDWLAYWLNNRRELLYNNSKNAYFYPVKKGGSILNTMFNRNFIPLQKLLNDPRTYINKIYYSQINNAASAKEKIREYRDDAEGIYDPIFHEIKYFYPYNNSTKIHERTHALNATPLESTIASILKSALINEEGYSKDYIKYAIKPGEIYGKMNEWRREEELLPNEQFTEDNLLSSEEDLKKKYELDMLDDATIIRLFNEVADNGYQNNKYNNISYAKKGIKLIPKNKKI